MTHCYERGSYKYAFCELNACIFSCKGLIDFPLQVLGEMCEGDAFGELALLQNSTRTATIICKTPCEFLKIDKEDFDQVHM